MLDILTTINHFGLETVLIALEEIATACKGGDDGYGALGTLLGDLDMARAVVNHFANVCK